MRRITPPQQRLLETLRTTGQAINLDARGRAYLADGTKVNRLTLAALVNKKELQPCGCDLLGDQVCAYRVSAA